MILFYMHYGKDTTRGRVLFSLMMSLLSVLQVFTPVKPSTLRRQWKLSWGRARSPPNCRDSSPEVTHLLCKYQRSGEPRHGRVFYDEATSVASFRVSARVPAGQTSFSTAAVVPLSKNNKLRLTHAPPVSASEGSVSVKFEILRWKSGGESAGR